MHVQGRPGQVPRAAVVGSKSHRSLKEIHSSAIHKTCWISLKFDVILQTLEDRVSMKLWRERKAVTAAAEKKEYSPTDDKDVQRLCSEIRRLGLEDNVTELDVRGFVKSLCVPNLIVVVIQIHDHPAREGPGGARGNGHMRRRHPGRGIEGC